MDRCTMSSIARLPSGLILEKLNSVVPYILPTNVAYSAAYDCRLIFLASTLRRPGETRTYSNRA